ncbi:hypothetical protein FRB94_007509 [Tulasnella sp. JGI-2019a]|nr:hypothetical protein FRB93_007137 [Tulasnella sp. JGI-2019a]KAG8997678.1 hypothetical protein FRB94_007509 [Tulasnella sp. JGI-2019a]
MLDEPTYTGSLCVTGNLLAHIHIQDSEQKLFIWDWVNGRYGVYQGDRNIIAVSVVQPELARSLTHILLQLDPILVAIYEDGALFVDRAQPNKMIKLSWPDSPIKEHLKPTSDPLVVDTPTISVEEEFFVSDPQDTLSDSGPHHMVRCSTDWSTIVQPPSLLISDGSQERTLLINIVPKSLGFVTRTHPISFVDGGDRPVFQGKTISGHVAVCDEKGGVTTLLSGGGSTYQVLERDINRQDTPTPIPFMCPISGTFGYMGDSGEIFIWQQK